MYNKVSKLNMRIRSILCNASTPVWTNKYIKCTWRIRNMYSIDISELKLEIFIIKTSNLLIKTMWLVNYRRINIILNNIIKSK